MRKVAIISIIAFLYVLSAHVGVSIAAPGTLVSPVWPPTGIALASVLMFGNTALLGIFIGCFIANAHMFVIEGVTLLSFLSMSVPAVGGVLQAYIGKLSLIKGTGSYHIFQNTRSVLIFILVTAFGVSMINASISTPFLVWLNKLPLADLPYMWLTWWVADAVGVIAVASTIIAWTLYWKIKISGRQLLILGVTWLCILLIGYLIIQGFIKVTYIYIPFAIWVAFQLDIRLSLLTGLLISAICLYDSAHITHYLQHASSINASLSQMQLFISIIYLTILLIHVILSLRKRAYDGLLLLNFQLEKLVLDRTSALLEANQELEIQKNKAIDAFEALKQSHARLMQSEKMASLGMLTAGVAHEIKHPLNATSANLKSIPKMMEPLSERIHQSHLEEPIKKDFLKTYEAIQALIAASHVGITRTAGVIADLSAFARQDEPEMVMTELNQNIDITLNLLSSEIRSNITIIKAYGDIPPLGCHPGKINQVMMNILVNALHALQASREGRIIIKTECRDNVMLISIKDNGPGMTKEVQDNLFTPFMTTKTDGMGAGLGLFLSNNIIKEHRGKIKVLSELGKGTEFIITIPLREG